MNGKTSIKAMTEATEGLMRTPGTGGGRRPSAAAMAVSGDFSTPARELPLDRIHPNPHEPRLEHLEEDIEATAESIKSGCQIEPITVRPRSDGDWELIAGRTRFEAMKRLNRETIFAVIRVVSDADAMLMALITNLGRKNLHDYEAGRSFNILLEAKTVSSIAELARVVGIERQTVHRCLDLARLPDPITDILFKHPSILGGSMAKALKELCDQGHTTKVAEAVQLVADNRLKQNMIPLWVKNEVKPPPPPTAKPTIASADGKVSATIRIRGRKLTAELKAKRATPQQMSLLERRFEAMVRELKITDDAGDAEEGAR